jgi:O-antigen/teichoic acid export membrane protein
LRILKNIVAALGTQVWSAAFGLLALPIFVRSFGIQAYGILALSLSVIGIASVCDLGIGRAVSKYISEEAELRAEGVPDRYIPTALTIVIVLSAVTTGILLIGAPLLVSTVFRIPPALARSAHLAFVFTSLAMPAVLLRILLDGVLVGHQRIAQLSGVNALFSSVKIAAGVIIALAGRQIEVLVIAYACLAYLQALALAWMCFRGREPLARLRIGWHSTTASKLFKLGLLSTLGNSTGYLLLYVDRWLLGVFLPIETVGVYSVTFDIASKQWYLANSISQAYFPVFSQYSKARAGLTKNYVDAMKLSSLLGTGAGFTLAVFQRPLLTYWIDPHFAAAAAVTGTVLSFALMVACYTNIPLTALLTASERPDVIAWLYAAAIAVHVALSVALIRSFGGVAVAVGFAAGYMLVLWGASVWLGKRSLDVTFAGSLRKCFVGPCAAALLTAVPLGLWLAPRLSNLLSVLTGMLAVYGVYLATAWQLTYSRGERSAVWRRIAATSMALGIRMRRRARNIRSVNEPAA